MTTTATPAPARKLRLIKFGSRTCGACLAMDKAKTLTKLRDVFPELTVVELLIADSNGESPELGDDGIPYQKNNEIADEYEVKALPTLVLEVEGYGEVGRIDGSAGLKDLKEFVQTQYDFADRAKLIDTW